jgi:phosphoadenosine phosphosulfate reductase
MNIKLEQIKIDEVVERQIDSISKSLIDLLKVAYNEFPDIQFASSFGAEDMVIHHAIHQSKQPIQIFTLDTERLPKETYTLIAQVKKQLNQKINIFHPNKLAVEEYVTQNGINAFYESLEMRKRCCYIRKVEPLERALSQKSAWMTGMRSEQAQTREALAIREFDESFQLEKFNPLTNWSENDVWAYIKINKVPYNKLHDQFYPSIGCAPCTRAISAGEDIRAGRWWWENPENKECGLHIKG